MRVHRTNAPQMTQNINDVYGVDTTNMLRLTMHFGLLYSVVNILTWRMDLVDGYSLR